MRTLLALLGVCALAWLVLSVLARRGIGTGLGPGWRLGGGQLGRRVQVLERITLSPKRQLYLVRADQRVLLLGIGEGGAPALITELADEPKA
jgi:flagellar biogenesis protein FliO